MALTLRLVLQTEGKSPRQFMLTGADALIGRADHGDIVVDHDTVSGRHGQFRANAMGYTYADLGSRNGSAIRKHTGELIALPVGEEVQLEPGDALLLGSVDRPARIEVEAGQTLFEPAPSVTQTRVATAPLADLLSHPPHGMAPLAAHSIAAETPQDLARAALQYIQQTVPLTAHCVQLNSAAFVLREGAPPPSALATLAQGKDELLQVSSGEGFSTAVIAPLIAHGASYGFLAAWALEPSSASSAWVEHLNVAAPLVALSASALAVRMAQATELSQRADKPDSPEDRPIGSAPEFLQAIDLAERLAASQVAVLLSGETGSGKEIFAKLIHARSPRAKEAFVAINCGAIPASLLESELFGHVEGAFTGAASDRAGVFEQADGGTLFLDELGEMPLAMQAGILRALENGEIRRVGDTQPRSVDVRLISATHKDLAKMAEAGAFRADLMYRIDAAKIRIPPLRKRGDDILQLAHHFLGQETRRAKRAIHGFSPEALLMLSEYAFPGNIRELKNEIARAVALTPEGSFVLPSAFSEKLTHRAALSAERMGQPKTLKETVAFAERHALETAIARAKGNLSEAARALGLSRPGLYKALERLGMRKSAGP